MLWARTIVVWVKCEHKCGYNSNHKLMQHMHSVLPVAQDYLLIRSQFYGGPGVSFTLAT